MKIHIRGYFAGIQQEAQLFGAAFLLEVEFELLKMCDFLAREELLASAFELIASLTFLWFCMAIVLHAHDLRILQIPDLLLQLLKIGLPIIHLTILIPTSSLFHLCGPHGQPLSPSRTLSTLLVDVRLRSITILNLPVIAPH